MINCFGGSQTEVFFTFESVLLQKATIYIPSRLGMRLTSLGEVPGSVSRFSRVALATNSGFVRVASLSVFLPCIAFDQTESSYSPHFTITDLNTWYTVLATRRHPAHTGARADFSS